jgi:hypothetical protein
MSDAPVTLNGFSGPASDVFATPPTSKKPWRAPLVIESSEAADVKKFNFPGDYAVLDPSSIGPS